MKATGIVRRIDDLGRVVIPKEIRRTMRIREGDPLEIYTDREGEVIFKKYSPIGEMSDCAARYSEILHKTCGINIAISDRETIIASSGLPKKEFNEKTLSHEVYMLAEKRVNYQYEQGTKKLAATDESSEYFISCAIPIITEGDVIGSVMSLVKETSERIDSKLELKLIQTAAGFLGKQLET